MLSNEVKKLQSLFNHLSFQFYEALQSDLTKLLV